MGCAARLYAAVLLINHFIIVLIVHSSIYLFSCDCGPQSEILFALEPLDCQNFACANMLFPLDFSTQNWPSAVFAVSVGIFLLWGLIASWRPRFPNAAPKLLKKNLPIVGSLGFFTRRRDFCNDGASNSKTGNYSFSIGRYNVVGVSGLQGRKVFYESKELNMTDGYVFPWILVMSVVALLRKYAAVMPPCSPALLTLT